VKNVFTLDFGHSRAYPDRAVNDIIGEQYPNSLLLGLLAFAWGGLYRHPRGRDRRASTRICTRLHRDAAG
jgi:hypothetical protein